jgi:hypothetical protein
VITKIKQLLQNWVLVKSGRKWELIQKSEPSIFPVILGREFLNKLEKELEGSNFLVSHLIADYEEYDMFKKERCYTHWIAIPLLKEQK